MSKSKKTQLKEKVDIFQLPKSQQYQIRNTYYSYDGCATKEMQKNYISFCDNLITKMCDNGDDSLS